MSSNTTLGFSIIGRYLGNDAMRQARADINGLRRQYGRFTDDIKKHTSFLDDMPFRWKAIAAGIQLVGPALVPLAAQFLATAGAAVTLGTVAAGAAGVFGAAVFGLVKAAMSNQKAVQANNQALASAKSAYQSTAASVVSAQNAVANAQRQYRDAQAGVTDAIYAVGRAERQVGSARQEYTDALHSKQQAIEAVRSAEDELSMREQGARMAQEDLTKARKDATQQLRDMNLQLKGNALDEESARLAVEQARQDLAAAKADKRSTSLDIQEKDLAYRQAKQQLTETIQRNKEYADQVRDANRAGVEGSQQVLAAKQKVADANRSVTDGEKSVRDAQYGVLQANQKVADAAQGIADAQHNVQKAQEGVTKANEQVAEAQRSISDAEARVAAAKAEHAKAAGDLAKAQAKANASIAAYTPMQQKVVAGIDQLKVKWAGFIKATEGSTGPFILTSLNAIGDSFKRLVPIVQAVGPVALSAARALQAWVNTRLDGWVNFIIAHGVPALQNFITIGKNLGRVFGDMLKAFAGDADKLGNSLARASAKLKGWADGGGFKRFLDYVHNNQPYVNALLKAFLQAVGNIVKIFDAFNPSRMQALTDVFRAISALDPGAAVALVNSFILLRSPILWLLLNCPPLRELIIKLLGALNAPTVYAIAAAFLAWRVAIMLVNLELLETPVGWIVLAIGAIVVAIVWIATKTTWFQTIWKYTWNGIKAGAIATWNGLKTAAIAVWNFLHGKWGWLIAAFGPIGWMIAIGTHWKQTWDFVKRVADTVWGGLKTGGKEIGHWFNHDFIGFFKVIGTWFKKDFVGFFSDSWGKIERGTATAVNSVIDIINGITGAWNTIVSHVGLKGLKISAIGHVKWGGAKRFADGGHVQGPGGPREDRIPALLSDGEFVMNAAAVSRYGLTFMHSINRQRFADGGSVGGDGGGGILGSIGHAIVGDVTGAAGLGGQVAKRVSGWVFGAIGDKAIQAAFNGLLPDSVKRMSGDFGKILYAGTKRVVDGLIKFLIDRDHGARSSVSGSVGGTIPTGQHKAIIDQALAKAGVGRDQWAMWEAGMNTLVTRESSWNPNAVNLTDINAQLGHPSKGLAQVIDPTFKAYGLGGSILDPVSNLVASIRYIEAVYHGIQNVQQANAALAPKGYVMGTDGASAGWHLVGENGPELAYFRSGDRVKNAAETASIFRRGGASGGEMHVTVLVGDKNLGEIIIDPLRKSVATRGGDVQAVLGKKGR